MHIKKNNVIASKHSLRGNPYTLWMLTLALLTQHDIELLTHCGSKHFNTPMSFRGSPKGDRGNPYTQFIPRTNFVIMDCHADARNDTTSPKASWCKHGIFPSPRGWIVRNVERLEINPLRLRRTPPCWGRTRSLESFGGFGFVGKKTPPFSAVFF